MIRHASDLQVIQQYREALRQSLDLFGLKSSITIQENIAILAVQQDALLKELRKPKSSEQDSAPGGWENLLDSQDPSIMFPYIQSSTGTFNFTSIGKDQHYTDSSHHITNINSSNNSTTVTTNTGNDLSVRLPSDGDHSSVSTDNDLVLSLFSNGVQDTRIAQSAKQDSVTQLSEILPKERSLSCGMQTMMKQMEPLRMGHEVVEKPPPIQGQGDDQQKIAAEHDKRRRDLSKENGWQVPVAASSQTTDLDQQLADLLALETSLQLPHKFLPVSTLGSKNPYHQTCVSHNPFVQPCHDSGSTDPYQGYAHQNRSGFSSSTNPVIHPPSQTMSTPNPWQHQHQRMFRAIQSGSGQFHVTHIGGNQNFVDSSHHVTNSNSGNTTTTITNNSNNDSSVRVALT